MLIHRCIRENEVDLWMFMETGVFNYLFQG